MIISTFSGQQIFRKIIYIKQQQQRAYVNNNTKHMTESIENKYK